MTEAKLESQQTIQADDEVLAHITVKLSDGSVADSTKVANKPSWLRLGRGDFSDAFEKQVIGRKVGDRIAFTLPAGDAFGEKNPDLIQFMDISHFPADEPLEEGCIMAFEQPNGETLPGIIRSVKADSVKVDFNHPLAGEAVTFELELLKLAERRGR